MAVPSGSHKCIRQGQSDGDFPYGACLQVKSQIDCFNGAYLCNVVQVVVLAA
jgi:hypothetical protein